jgi:hypothetical protein
MMSEHRQNPFYLCLSVKSLVSRVTILVARFFIGFFIALTTVKGLAATPNKSCLKILLIASRGPVAEFDYRSLLLENPNVDSDEQTVFYQGSDTTGYVYLSKAFNQSWKSHYQLMPGSFTPQGDPRNPILFFGIELSRLLGFDFHRVHGKILLRAPGAKLLFEKLTAANRSLPDHQKLSYLPKSAGFLNSSDAVDFSLNTSNGFLFAFPYADSDEALAVHEIAFHLGALIYPRKFFARARAINEQIQKFVAYLNSQDHRLANNTAEDLISQIMRDRMAEIDVGSANPQAILSHYRRINHFIPYRELLSTQRKRLTERGVVAFIRVSDIEVSMIEKAIEHLAQPHLTPQKALLLRLSHLTGLQFEDYLRPEENRNYRPYVNVAMGLGVPFDLRTKDQAAMRKIIYEYLSQVDSKNREQAGQETYEISNSAVWYRHLLESLDQNIENLIRALQASGGSN